MSAFKRKDLEAHLCERGRDLGDQVQELLLTVKCHNDGFEALYYLKDGTLLLRCKTCGRPAALIEVAGPTPDRTAVEAAIEGLVDAARIRYQGYEDISDDKDRRLLNEAQANLLRVALGELAE
jgi:hypothetical protein